MGYKMNEANIDVTQCTFYKDGTCLAGKHVGNIWSKTCLFNSECYFRKWQKTEAECEKWENASIRQHKGYLDSLKKRDEVFQKIIDTGPDCHSCTAAPTKCIVCYDRAKQIARGAIEK